MRTYVCIYIYAYICIYVCIYTHTCTYTLTLRPEMRVIAVPGLYDTTVPSMALFSPPSSWSVFCFLGVDSVVPTSDLRFSSFLLLRLQFAIQFSNLESNPTTLHWSSWCASKHYTKYTISVSKQKHHNCLINKKKLLTIVTLAFWQCLLQSCEGCNIPFSIQPSYSLSRLSLYATCSSVCLCI